MIETAIQMMPEIKKLLDFYGIKRNLDSVVVDIGNYVTKWSALSRKQRGYIHPEYQVTHRGRECGYKYIAHYACEVLYDLLGNDRCIANQLQYAATACIEGHCEAVRPMFFSLNYNYDGTKFGETLPNKIACQHILELAAFIYKLLKLNKQHEKEGRYLKKVASNH